MSRLEVPGASTGRYRPMDVRRVLLIRVCETDTGLNRAAICFSCLACVYDAWEATGMTDTSCTDPLTEKHTRTNRKHTHTHKAGAHQRTSLLVLTHFFFCRTRLETPPGASGCSARRATAKPTCSSATPPTTCRGFWVATPPGWAPRTPPCCKPSSARVRVVHAHERVAGGVCWRLCVRCSSSYCCFFPLQQASADGTVGARRPAQTTPSLSLRPPSPPRHMCPSTAASPRLSHPSLFAFSSLQFFWGGVFSFIPSSSSCNLVLSPLAGRVGHR